MANLYQPSLQRAFNSDGTVSSGAKLYFYLTETSTLSTVYTSQEATTPLSNPVVADSTGKFAPVYLSTSHSYRVVQTNSTGSQTAYDVDPVRGYDDGAVQTASTDAIAAAAEADADVVLTHADVVLTHADVVLTHADVLTTNADAASASDDADRAETAAEEALINGNLYVDTTTGLANTSGTGSTNRYFAVPATDTNYVKLYRNNAGVATFINTFPSKSALAAFGLVLPALPTQADIFVEFDANSFKGYFQGNVSTDLTQWMTDSSTTFVRGGSHHPYFTSAGLLAEGTANTPRVSYDPITLAPGLLNEPTATNLYAYSRLVDVGGASTWHFASTGVTQTDNAATGIDGTTSASVVAQDSSTGVHQIFYWYVSGTITSGSPYTWSLIIKPNGTTKIRLDPESTSGLGMATVDFTAGTVTGTGWNIEAWANGFYRVWKSWTAATSEVLSFQIFLLNSSGSDTFAGDGTSGVSISGVQLEAVPSVGTRPSTYIERANTAAGVRAADALTLTLPVGVSHVTFTYPDNNQQVVSASPGSYTVPTTLTETLIKSFISVDLTSAGVPITSVAGKSGPTVTLVQADVGGLTTGSSPSFTGLTVTGKSQTMGDSVFKSDTVLSQWTISGPTLTSADRGQVIGYKAAQAVSHSGWSNSIVIGTEAAKVATTITTAVVIGDTAVSGSGTVTGSVAIGNEAGNGTGDLGAVNIIGNGTNLLGSAGSNARGDVMGQLACRFNRVVDTVAVGWSAGTGSTSTRGSHTQSVFIGSGAGQGLVGDRTGNVIIGYNQDAPTTTTDNYLNIAGVLVGSMVGSTPTFTIQKPSGAQAKLKVAKLNISSIPTSSSGLSSGDIWSNGGVLTIV